MQKSQFKYILKAKRLFLVDKNLYRLSFHNRKRNLLLSDGYGRDCSLRWYQRSAPHFLSFRYNFDSSITELSRSKHLLLGCSFSNFKAQFMTIRRSAAFFNKVLRKFSFFGNVNSGISINLVLFFRFFAKSLGSLPKFFLYSKLYKQYFNSLLDLNYLSKQDFNVCSSSLLYPLQAGKQLTNFLGGGGKVKVVGKNCFSSSFVYCTSLQNVSLLSPHVLKTWSIGVKPFFKKNKISSSLDLSVFVMHNEYYVHTAFYALKNFFSTFKDNLDDIQCGFYDRIITKVLDPTQALSSAVYRFKSFVIILQLLSVSLKRPLISN